mgnify:CR=1 FL=1
MKLITGQNVAVPPQDKVWADHAAHVREVAAKFSPWILILPAALCLWIGTQPQSPLWEYTHKVYQEKYGPAVLMAAVGLAAALWMIHRGFYYRWLTILCVCLLCRELHFRGTSTGIYFAIPLVLWYASANYASMKPFVNHRLLVSLFVGAFITYFFTITVDRAVWKFLPRHADWRNNVEETLETFGHLMILAMIIVSASLSAGGNSSKSTT